MRSAPYSVVYSDSDIVAVSKASGLCVAADRYNSDAPRLDVMLEREFGKVLAVHRIDKDTSGLVVYARNGAAQRALSLQFQNHTVRKTYHCLVYGRPEWEELTVTLPLLPDGDARHRTVVRRRGGKPSETYFRRLACAGRYTWLEARPRTGRTHQIRAHLASQGVFIVCDPLYSGNQHPVLLSEIKRGAWRGDPLEERPLLSRLALHSYELGLSHPATGERISFRAPYPKDMDAVRAQLAKIFGEDPLTPSAAGSSEQKLYTK